MASSLPQMSATLGLCISSKKINNAQPCIAQLQSKKSTQLSNHFAKHQIAKGAFFPLVGQNKKPLIDLWKAPVGEDPEFGSTHSDIKTIVENFYNAFNSKQIEKLKQLLSDNCVYQDLLFYSSFRTKQSGKKRKYPSRMDADSLGLKKRKGGLLICEINGLDELPVKPGELVLDLIKVLSTFFDSYPPMASVLLENLASQEDNTHD